jgi:hypothetical protein
MRDGRTGVLCVALRGWAVGLVGLVSGAGGVVLVGRGVVEGMLRGSTAWN